MSPWTKQVVIHNGEMEIKGWAYSGGGRWIERVETSPDGGFTWYSCPVQNMSKKYKVRLLHLLCSYYTDLFNSSDGGRGT
jgi:hypothetical protein